MDDDGPPAGAQYRPFPPFTHWAATAAGTLDLVDRFASLFAAARQDAEPDAVDRLVERATRWAAIDTGAIEGLYDTDRGFTVGVATSAAMLATIGREKGAAVERSVRDALAAYELVLDIATRREVVTAAAIRELHAVVCASQETYTVYTDVGPQQHELPKGAYKTVPNSPLNLRTGRVHAYASVDDTPAETARLVAELRTPAFEAAHPVLQASYAHYAFVCVHPFADGNGRVARALAAIFTYRAYGIPLIIFADQKPGYLDALEAADGGDDGPFVAFVGERLIDTMQALRDELTAGRVTLSDRVTSALAALRSPSGMLHDEMDAIAQRILDAFRSELNTVLASAALRPPLVAAVRQVNSVIGGFAPYRAVPQAHALPVLQIDSGAPASGSGTRVFDAAVSTDGDPAVFEFLLVDDAGGRLLEIGLREANPAVSISLLHRLRAQAERSVAALLDEVSAQGQASLRQTGYLD